MCQAFVHALPVALCHLSQREQLAGQRAVPGLHPLELRLGTVCHQLVETDLRQVEVEVPRENGQATLERYERVGVRFFTPSAQAGSALARWPTMRLCSVRSTSTWSGMTRCHVEAGRHK